MHAPIIGKPGTRAFIANGVAMNRVTKQVDVKIAFCHPTPPDDNVCIVTPPKGCPFSKPGDCWLLKKTLCGLHRSPRHWCQTLCGALTDIGLTPCDHDPCVCTSTTPTGETVCVGTHVDDVICWGMNDEAELWFEQQLKERVTVDFVGAVSWCLRIHCEWSRTKDDRLSVHSSQEAQATPLPLPLPTNVEHPSIAHHAMVQHPTTNHS